MVEKCIKIHIRGLVQGVGFRPFIYRIANDIGIKGEVENHTDGVIIRAILTENEYRNFVERIQKEKPEVSFIHSITASNIPNIYNYTSFTILSSCSETDEVTRVAPDIAVCSDCINDRKSDNHRQKYPFINCTHCGPRFSIIKDLPYDRKQTTMSSFVMCPVCKKEYITVEDRRFHAQPIACNYCGPSYYISSSETDMQSYSYLLEQALEYIKNEEVIAVKGIGGYHLVCDALSEKAVSYLREIKARDAKPFAVMFRDINSLKKYVFVSKKEKECITSWRRPIVLLKQYNPLATGINPEMKTLGCMLPYMPFHYDLFDKLHTPALVMTSGNLNDLPIAITPEEAEEQFKVKVSFILHHNRDIHNRIDDSVLQVCNDQPCLIRRSRGYVPEPLFVDMPVEGILAFGAEKVNTFALGKGKEILQSQYIGDLKNWETFQFYRESLERFQHLFRFKPKKLVCDLHPDYFSSREAERLAKLHSLPLLKVQHHHAHAVACMAEYNLEEPVIAIIMDGSGLGDDGNIWGGEFFLCDRKQYQRLAHLEYIPLPGGDKASLEPWRMATSYLHTFNLPFPEDFIRRVGENKINELRRIIDKRVNTPLISGGGRLFDAVASLLGICDISSWQAEAPVLLEQYAITNSLYNNEEFYPFSYLENVLSMRSLFENILYDMENKKPICLIAAKFHITLARMFTEKAGQLLDQTGTSKVVISGGCFQNKFLVELMQQLFVQSDIPLYVPSRIPCNDEGISVGQLVVASCCLITSSY